jgi:hypothetical protein
MATTTALSQLKLTAAAKPHSASPVATRRQKLSKRIWEQMELAKSQVSGTAFVCKKFRTITDTEGNRRSIELPKRVRAWWFTGEQGQLVLQIHYGSQVLELARGKSSVEVADSSALVGALQVVHTAVMAGELDQQIEAAANTLKSRF